MYIFLGSARQESWADFRARTVAAYKYKFRRVEACRSCPSVVGSSTREYGTAEIVRTTCVFPTSITPPMNKDACNHAGKLY